MNSLVLGQSFQKSVNELQSVVAECSDANWDGYSAYPVTSKQYGSEPFLGNVPPQILNLISRVATA